MPETRSASRSPNDSGEESVAAASVAITTPSADLASVMTLLQQVLHQQTLDRAQQAERALAQSEEIARLASRQEQYDARFHTTMTSTPPPAAPADTAPTAASPDTTCVDTADKVPVGPPAVAVAPNHHYTLKSAQPPAKLQPTIPLAAFHSWVKTWRAYATLSGIAAFPTTMQVTAFRTLLDHEMLTILETRLQVTEDTADTVDVIISKIQTWLRQQRNIIRDRVEFQERRQHDGESFRSYLVALYDIAQNCDFCSCSRDDRFITNVIRGVNDADLRKKLLEKKITSLDTCVNICETYETAKDDNAVLSSSLLVSAATHSRRAATNSPQTQAASLPQPPASSRNKATGASRPKTRCRGCNGTCIIRESECPAWGTRCPHCSIVNHSGDACRRKPASPSRPVPVTPVVNTMICPIRASNKAPRIHCNFDIAGSRIVGKSLCLPDSGAEATCMGWGDAQRLGIPKALLSPHKDPPIRAANGAAMHCMGSVKARITHNGVTATDVVHVFPQLDGILLSWFTSMELGILPPDYPAAVRPTINTATGSPPSLASQDTAQLRRQLLDEFHDVFASSSALQPMKTTPMSIQLRPGATPFHIRAARSIPFAWRDDTKQLLDSMVASGIIAPVLEPTAWCAPMHVTAKPNGGLRIVGDMRELNKHVVRPVYPLVTPKDAVSSISRDAKIFTTLDAKSGYWQVPLDEDSQLLTTFLTPWGRFKYCRATMGLISSGDEYNQRGDVALGNLTRTVKVVDDILLHDTNLTDHITHLRTVLERCRAHRITLNPDKFVFAQPSVDYVGYKISASGPTADPNKLRAISQFPSPTNASELRSFFGMAEQLSSFAPSLASLKEPLRPLLQSRNLFQWLPEHEVAFTALKAALLKPPILGYFDPLLPLVLQTDASRLKGLGFALMQQQDGHWRLIDCGSRFLSDTETRYAMIELECLAVAWAAKKCDVYLRGQPSFTVLVDHKPLVPILNTYPLSAVDNPRLQRLKEKLSAYTFTVEWRSGKSHCIPDALSRAPTDDPLPVDLLAEGGDHHINQLINAIDDSLTADHRTASPPSDPTLDMLRHAATADASYAELCRLVKHGFPPTSDGLPPALRPFHKLRDELSLDNDLVLRGSRIIVPAASRSEILTRLHASHQGIVRTKQRARQAVFWPGITSDITTLVETCQACQELLPSHAPEPLIPDDVPPTRIFESTSADFFVVHGHHFLVYADRFSGWPSVSTFSRDPSSAHLRLALAEQFANTGIPSRLRSDGGPQFISAEFADFCSKWGIAHTTSSPTYAQSNGHAEANVKKLKHLLLKTTLNGNFRTEDFYEGLLELRNTPLSNGRSPAEIIFNRPMRTRIPLHYSALSSPTRASIEESARKAAAYVAKTKEQYDNDTRPLRLLSVGDTVRLQDPRSKRWSHLGRVIRLNRDRDYIVRLTSGSVLRRNRRFLRLAPASGSLQPGLDPVSRPADTDPVLPPAASRHSTRDTRPPQRYSNSCPQADC